MARKRRVLCAALALVALSCFAQQHLPRLAIIPLNPIGVSKSDAAAFTTLLTAKIIDVTTGKNLKADTVCAQGITAPTDQVELLAYKMAGLTQRTGGDDTQIRQAAGGRRICGLPEPAGRPPRAPHLGAAGRHGGRSGAGGASGGRNPRLRRLLRGVGGGREERG